MDRLENMRSVLEFLKKYKYAAIILLAGIALMLIPASEEKDEITVPVCQEPSLQDSLEKILTEIYGAGKVSVLLTQSAGEETLFQENRDVSLEEGRENNRIETVLVSGTGREEAGLIRQVNAPVYRGAVIVCQGADNAAVRLAVVEAVKSATGLTTDHISVLKMK